MMELNKCSLCGSDADIVKHPVSKIETVQCSSDTCSMATVGLTAEEWNTLNTRSFVEENKEPLVIKPCPICGREGFSNGSIDGPIDEDTHIECSDGTRNCELSRWALPLRLWNVLYCSIHKEQTGNHCKNCPCSCNETEGEGNH